MGVPFERAMESVETAASELFARDPAVRSVGVTRHDSGFGYRAVRNSQVIVAEAAVLPSNLFEIPVVFTETPGEVRSLVTVPGSGVTSPATASLVPEVQRQRPLVCGLQIQNFDDDVRQGVIEKGFMTVGTLGCFVHLMDGRPALLSNNHVVAGENRGQRGRDRILQPGSGSFTAADQVAALEDFVALQFSPAGASPKAGTALLNEVDAGVALLLEEPWKQEFLSFRALPYPLGIAAAKTNDRVFKVGRTTGLTHGEVKDIAAVVGPVGYGPGPCWFRRSLVIEGVNGTMFSDHGDSGSAILRENGEVVGLLYAGNGQQTYACPIDSVLQALKCSLA
jgi:hypothetical protein